jgi:hypothetical protein
MLRQIEIVSKTIALLKSTHRPYPCRLLGLFESDYIVFFAVKGKENPRLLHISQYNHGGRRKCKSFMCQNWYSVFLITQKLTQDIVGILIVHYLPLG